MRAARLLIMLGQPPGSFTSASGHVQTRPDGPDKGPASTGAPQRVALAPSAGSIES